MLQPLKQFVCDACNQVILKPEDGCLEWIHDLQNQSIHSFRITHNDTVSPLEGSEGCRRHGNAPGRRNDELDEVIIHVIPEMLGHLDVGRYHDPTNNPEKVTDLRNFAETFRRLSIPYYEEARLYWDQAISNGDFDEENNVSIFSEPILLKVIEKYSRFGTGPDL